MGFGLVDSRGGDEGGGGDIEGEEGRGVRVIEELALLIPPFLKLVVMRH